MNTGDYKERPISGAVLTLCRQVYNWKLSISKDERFVDRAW